MKLSYLAANEYTRKYVYILSFIQISHFIIYRLSLISSLVVMQRNLGNSIKLLSIKGTLGFMQKKVKFKGPPGFMVECIFVLYLA